MKLEGGLTKEEGRSDSNQISTRFVSSAARSCTTTELAESIVLIWTLMELQLLSWMLLSRLLPMEVSSNSLVASSSLAHNADLSSYISSGLLAITCTDMAVSAGHNYPEKW